MDKERTKVLSKSAAIALIVALLFPALWQISFGEEKRSPIVEAGYIESMPEHERSQWLQENLKPVSTLERIKDMPAFVLKHWVGYLQTSLGVFIFVFIINTAYLLGGIKNVP